MNTKSTTILKLTADQAQNQNNTIMRLDRILNIMAEVADERKPASKSKPKRKS